MKVWPIALTAGIGIAAGLGLWKLTQHADEERGSIGDNPTPPPLQGPTGTLPMEGTTAPTTAIPATSEPTTAPPTSAPATSAPATSTPATTAPPTTATPQTQPPTTQPPVTEPPTTQPPVTTPPTTGPKAGVAHLNGVTLMERRDDFRYSDGHTATVQGAYYTFDASKAQKLGHMPLNEAYYKAAVSAESRNSENNVVAVVRDAAGDYWMGDLTDHENPVAAGAVLIGSHHLDPASPETRAFAQPGYGDMFPDANDTIS